MIYLRALRLWGGNVLVALSQLLSALVGLDPDETLSSHIGKKRDEGHRWAAVFAAILDWVDPEHTRKSIERDEGSNSVWAFLKRELEK